MTMTRASLNYILLFLLHAGTFWALSLAQKPCHDDPFYTFGRYTWTKLVNKENNNGQTEGQDFKEAVEVETIRTCAWLNTNNAKIRKANWCAHKAANGILIADKCRQSCGQCTSIIPSRNCHDSPKNWTDVYGNDCKFYKQLKQQQQQKESMNKNNVDHHCEGIAFLATDANGISAKEACCVCGGGCSDVLVDSGEKGLQPVDRFIPWHDSGGEFFSCDWYAAGSSRCIMYGSSFRNYYYFPKDACCTCGGGLRSTKN